MRIGVAAGLAMLAASSGGAQERTTSMKPVLAEDFETDSGAVYRTLARDPRLVAVAGEGVGGSRALRTTYVGGPTGSGVMARAIPLGEAGSDYTLNYDVRFDRDFQFVRGGKMHGFGPARSVTGGDPLRPDGWSARVMWREKGRPVTYTYHQDQRDKYGDDGPAVAPFAFALDRYYAVSLHVRLNDPESANGLVRLYVDGALVSAQEGLRLRSVASKDSLIGNFLFSTFHGGHDPSWAPRNAAGAYVDVHAYYDNIAVYPGERIRKRPGG